MKMLDYEMKKTDDLLYRMIPKPVAKRLRKGEPAVNTCEVSFVDRSVYNTPSATISKPSTGEVNKTDYLVTIAPVNGWEEQNRTRVWIWCNFDKVLWEGPSMQWLVLGKCDPRKDNC